MAAPLMTISSAEILLNAAATEASSPTSHETHSAVPASPPSAISNPYTCAPPAANIFAVASPIPDPAPVTTAFNPANSVLMRLSILYQLEMCNPQLIEHTFLHQFLALMVANNARCEYLLEPQNVRANDQQIPQHGQRGAQ